MFSLKDKENYPSVISNLLFYLVYWPVKQCPNKTYSLQILNCTAPGQDWFFFVPTPPPPPPPNPINHHTTFLDREGIVLSFVPWSLIMLLMQVKLIYNRWKLDLIPLLFSFLYIIYQCLRWTAWQNYIASQGVQQKLGTISLWTSSWY